jgi:IS5 family transposase
MVSLHYLKYAYNLSDESTVSTWVENPYRQYLSGMIYFEHKLPIDPSSMTRWRKRLGEQAGEELLKQTILTALKQGHLKTQTTQRVNIDATVGEKNISHPTDGKLYVRSMQRLVKKARKIQLPLRQTYQRVAKKQLLSGQRYAHAKQLKRARSSAKKLHAMLGRLMRDIMRKSAGAISTQMEHELEKAHQLLTQTRHSKKNSTACMNHKYTALAKANLTNATSLATR